jgi:hypothetical protein
MTTLQRKAIRDKVRAHRERLRRQGLRPLQIWVPDVESPAFRKQAHRQSLADMDGSRWRGLRRQAAPGRSHSGRQLRRD